MNVEKIQARLRQILDPAGRLREGAIKEAARLIARSSESLPSGESADSRAITFGSIKTAALCYDRIWTFDRTVVPPEVGFFAGSDAELLVALRIIIMPPMARVYGRLGSPLIEYSSDEFIDFGVIRDELLPKAMKAPLGKPQIPRENITIGTTTKAFAQILSTELGCAVTPVYSSKVSHNEEYAVGSYGVVAASLMDLELVDEDNLKWEQVLQFRQDVKSRENYRRLVHWLDIDMVGKPTTVVVEEIGIRLEAYRAALKKHGIQTRMGMMEMILDSHGLLSATAAGIASASLSQNALITGITAGGVGTLVVLGKVAMRIQQSKLDLEELQLGSGSEIAFIHEVSKTR